MRLKLHHQILIAMLIGAGIGLPLSILAANRSLAAIDPGWRRHLAEGPLSDDLRSALAEQGVVMGADAALKPGRVESRWIVHDAAAGRRYTLVVSEASIDVLGGRIAQRLPETIARYGKGIGDVFLQLLKMIVAPLIATSLITGVAGTGSVRGLGRMGGRTIVLYMTTSLIAIITGIILVNLIRPGAGADLDALQAGAEEVSTTLTAADVGVWEVLWQQLFTLIPSNPFAALADPSNTSILGVIFFSLLFGVFVTLVGGETGELLTKFFSGAFDVMMRMTMAIIRLAPIGVFGFMLYAAAGKGVDVFVALGWYALTVALGLTFHGFVTLPLLVLLLARRSPWEFFKAMSPALLTAFSTASSNGTLPLTITCVEERAGVSNRTSSFVLPLGATINMDGTALYEAVAVLFIAQAYGNDLGLAQQAIVALTALLASVGAAGIPHAGTVMMVVVLGAVGLPLDAVGLILAVDRILDMYRTSINVWSDSTICSVIDRMEEIGRAHV